MARPDPSSAPGRLTAVLGVPPGMPPRGPGPDSTPVAGSVPVGDQPTGPLPRVVLGGGDAPRSGRLWRLLPAAWRDARVDPGRPGATVLALVAAAAAVVAAIGVWVERPRAEPVGGLPEVAVVAEPAATAAAETATVPVPAPAAPTTGSTTVPAEPLVVSVSGRVVRPGLVEVPAGSRVADALAAAGGPVPGTDLAGLNLARRVVDGEQVAVGVPPAPDALPGAAGGAGGPAPPGSGPAAPGRPPGKLDLNSATPEQLDALPGVGPVTAQRILEWRTRHGRFARVEQLREIEGIGERRFGQLRELVTV
ncbi:ComEA family DNA-binding protein [Pseudonocardia xinjiangensis]|uniref:ComEA family DNA-binding protein n=1 Tax=Pseudonocardia xinjiangensis TaxID=75289 RepID=UPI003D9055C2